jgi:hypothetical protein
MKTTNRKKNRSNISKSIAQPATSGRKGSIRTSVQRIGKDSAAIQTGGKVYTVSMSSFSSNFSQLFDSSNWEMAPQVYNGVRIVPHGANNDLPEIVRDIMAENNLAPGILERQIGLLYANGPGLYRLNYDNGQITREYLYDKEIHDWLKTWDWRRFLDMALVEYKHLKGFYVKSYRNKASRIGERGFINSLQVVPGTDARLGWPEFGAARLENVKTIYVGDFFNNILGTGLTAYPVFNPNDPFRYGVSMSYHNTYSFAYRFYSVPSFFGTFKWLWRSSEIPDILKYLGKNGISAAFHIHSPQGYWESKRLKLEEQHQGKTAEEIEELLQDLKDQLFGDISAALAGNENAGKFIETVDFYDDEGNLCQWKIEAIDQKIGDFIEAQLEVGKQADSASTSGMGLHPSLANIIIPGQLGSGSQMLYALKLFWAAETAIPESVIFEAINRAITANWPQKDGIQMGFYRPIVEKEDNVSSKDRLTNNI